MSCEFSFVYIINFYSDDFIFFLKECAHRFPVPLYENEGKKQEKFVLTAPQDQLRCAVTLTGDSITQAVRFN